MTKNHTSLSIGQTMLWLSVGTVVYFFTQWLLTVIVVRLGSTQIAGDYALVLSSSSIFYSISLFGMRNYQISDAQMEHSTESYLSSRLLTCLVALICGVVFCLMSTFTEVQKACLMLFLVFRVSEGGMDVFHGALQARWRMDIAGRSLILRGIIEFVLFTVTLFVTHQLFWSLAIMTLFSLAWLLTYEYRATRKVTGFQSRLLLDPKTNAGLGKLLLSCLPLLVGNLSYSLIFFEPRYQIERIYGTETLGIYATIAAPTLIILMLATYIFTPYMPKMSTLFQDGKTKELSRLFLKLFFAIAAISLVVLLAVLILGKWGLAILFGAEVAQQSAWLMPITVSLIFVTYYYYLSAAIVSIRRTSAVYWSSGIGIIACLLLSEELVRRFGPNGASYAIMIAQFLQTAFLAIYYGVSIRRSAQRLS